MTHSRIYYGVFIILISFFQLHLNNEIVIENKHCCVKFNENTFLASYLGRSCSDTNLITPSPTTSWFAAFLVSGSTQLLHLNSQSKCRQRNYVATNNQILFTWSDVEVASYVVTISMEIRLETNAKNVSSVNFYLRYIPLTFCQRQQE